MPDRPPVCAVTLTRDRPEMLANAITCFKKQTYSPKFMFILDTGSVRLPGLRDDREAGITVKACPGLAGSIGELRNLANDMAVFATGAQILMHWDDDDRSHKDRMLVQILRGLTTHGYPVSGFHSLPFIDLRSNPAEVWEYRGEPGYAIGSSLAYFAHDWKRRPFLDVPYGEDSKFLDGTTIDGKAGGEPFAVYSTDGRWAGGEPIMICGVHSASVSARAGFRRFRRDDGTPFVPSEDEERLVRAWEDMIK